MGITQAAKNTMLNGLTIDRIQLHSADPGDDGQAAAIPGTMKQATFATAIAGTRQLQADVPFTGLAPRQKITHLSFWAYNSGTPICQASAPIEGDTTANDAGEFTVTADGTALKLI